MAQPTPEQADAEALRRILKGTQCNLREAIELLIERREAQRDEVLAELDLQAGELLDALAEDERQRLVAELTCFRDVLRLHRRLSRNDGRKN